MNLYNIVLSKLYEFKNEISKFIDQTFLKPNADEKSIMKFIEESDPLNFRSLVIPQSYVKLASEIAKTPIVTVISFPLGYSFTESKLKEIELAAANGAKEVDVVSNIILIKSDKWSQYRDEIHSLINIAHSLGLKIKVIIETGLLTRDEIIKASRIIEEEGADFIKTCTGFGPRGVIVSDIILIKMSTRGKVGIKASGGIRTALDAITYILMGASCIGTSSGISIVKEAEELSQNLVIHR